MGLGDLDDHPLVSPAIIRSLSETAKYWLDEIDDLLSHARYDFATDTLTGIRDTIQRTMTITDGQRRAITNIRGSVRERGDRSEPGGRGGSRRYEGWTRG